MANLLERGLIFMAAAYIYLLSRELPLERLEVQEKQDFGKNCEE